MPNFSGASQGYLNFDQAQQQKAKDAMQLRLLMENLSQQEQQTQANQTALQARRTAGQGLSGAMFPPQQPGVPPPPGTPQGGPQPPGVGVSSPQPQQAPQPPPMQPGGGVPPPPSGMQFNNPTPGGANLDFKGINPAQIQALMQKIQNPAIKQEAMGTLNQAQQIPPFKSMPTEAPPAPGGGGGVPPPPAQAEQPQSGLPVEQIQDFSKKFFGALKEQGVPPEQWIDAFNQLPAPLQNDMKTQIALAKQQNDALLRIAGLGQKDRALDQGDRRLDIAQQKVDRLLAGDDAVKFDDTDTAYWAQVMENGGSLPPRLATTPGGKKLVADVMKATARSGTGAKEMLANQAEFMGEKAGQRTLGTRTANIEMAATEADSLSKLALKASDEWKRSGIKSLNDLEKYAQGKTSSPELRRFVAANTSFINAYARAINPQGVGTVADKEHAREMLEVGFSNGDYAAAIDQLQSEIGAAKASPGTVKQEMRDRFTGGAASTVNGTVMPKDGEKRVINGTPAHWDGKGWLAD